MKRASYRDAVDFIAHNDEPGFLQPEDLYGQASVVLVATIFGVPVEKVAKDVVRLRVKWDEAWRREQRRKANQ